LTPAVIKQKDLPGHRNVYKLTYVLLDTATELNLLVLI